MKRLRAALTGREALLVLAILAVVALVALLGRADLFLQAGNQTRLWRQIGLLGVFAVGEAVVVLVGGIDLSVGSVIALSGLLSALTCQAMLSHAAALSGPLLAVALGVAVLVGMLTGLLHAVLINGLRLPPFIATLATLAGLRSVSQLITNSSPVPVADASFAALAAGSHALWFFAAAALGLWLLLDHTATGRSLRALGGSEDASRLSGLPTARLKLIAYCLSGALAGLAGILHASYSGQGDPRLGAGYELRAIAACVVGGFSLNGGVGTVGGVVLGVILMQTVLNAIGLVITQNSTLWEGLVTGVVVMLAVAASSARRARA